MPSRTRRYPLGRWTLRVPTLNPTNRNRSNARLFNVTSEQSTQGPELWYYLNYGIKVEECEYKRLLKIIEAGINKKISKVSARLCESGIAGYKLNLAAKFDVENRGAWQIYINPVPSHIYGFPPLENLMPPLS